MANAEFQRSPKAGKFLYTGVDLHHPADMMPPARAPFLLNVSPNIVEGALQARPGMTIDAVVNAGNTIHSIKRVNDLVPGAVNPFARFIGSAGNLYEGQAGSYPMIDSGYSGNPLSLVPYRPPQSPETWLYVFDSIKKQKYKCDGVTKFNIGIAVPNTPPTTVLANAPAYTIVQDATASGSWTATGDAGAPSTANRVPGGITTLATVFDTGSTGWCDVALQGSTTGYSWLSLGMRIEVDSESVTVEQVFQVTSTTVIAAVIYDSGSTGPCTVAVTKPQQAMVRNQMISVAGNYMRVLSVTAGPDGSYSFRTSAPATISTGQTITFLPGFRCYFTTNHVGGASVSGTANTSALTFSTGAGQVALSGLSLDLSVATGTPLVGSPFTQSLTGEDYMTIGFQCDNPLNLVEIHFVLDVDASTNDFTRNYYYYIARQGDFTPILLGSSATIPALLTQISTDVADTYNATSQATTSVQSPYPVAPILETNPSPDINSQMPTGKTSWFQAMFKINDLVRVGDDQSVNLQNVKAVAIQFILTGNCNVAWGSWWVGGGYGPDANFNSYGNQGLPIQYRYRYRSSQTGAISDVSPATRNGDLPRRQQISVSVTASGDSQVDLIDIERFGGSHADWRMVFTVPNTTGTYADLTTEAQARGSQPLDLKQYVPFPVTDKPRSGTCNVIGTRVVQQSGDAFNLSWIRGVEIIVNNQTYTLYAPPISSNTLETNENIGYLLGVNFKIPEATIAGANLPYAWESKGNDVIMACGDVYNPGYLYFTNRGNPDSAADSGYIEVTSPSEPLIGGGHYEGADYAFTTEGVYRVEPTQGGVNPFASYKLSLTYGLAGPWAFTVDAPFIFYVATDGGIYMFNPAGQSQRISNDLYPLFPFEGRPGQPYNIAYLQPATVSVFFPPNFSLSQYMRLEFVNNQIFFDYVDTTSTYHTFRYDMEQKGWIPYFYNPQIVMRYQEEGVQNPQTLLGSATGNLYFVSASLLDGASTIECLVATPADDQGDSRMIKQYGDVMIDFQGNIKVQTYFKQFEVSPSSTMVAFGPQFPRGQQVIPVVSSGNGQDSSWQRSIGLTVTWFTV